MYGRGATPPPIQRAFQTRTHALTTTTGQLHATFITYKDECELWESSWVRELCWESFKKSGIPQLPQDCWA